MFRPAGLECPDPDRIAAVLCPPLIARAETVRFVTHNRGNFFQCPANRDRIGFFRKQAGAGSLAVAYIVDGNNVMGQTPGWHRDKSGARRRLVEELAEFARVMRVRVSVVFDGAPDREMPEASAYRGVKVLYAEKGSDADSRIAKLVESAQDPRGLMVVTSDRHLAFLVRSSGARVIRSGEFRKQLQVLRSKPVNEDGEQFGPVETNGWLRYFGVLPEDDDE